MLETLQRLRTGREHAGNFAAWRTLPARAAEFAGFPDWLDARLAEALRSRGIASLYSHQRAAAEAAHAGRNLVVVTPTASGKTLCYNLPVLQAMLDDPEARALYLFPTKALSQDQYAELHSLIDALGAEIKTHTYDGDTPGEVRRAVRSAGHIVVTNPDMLHTGVLPHHTKWVKLFENLRFVVIDELHTYRGVFGSHLANLVRRLRRICRFYGSDPVFICCSATIANPRELAETLLAAPVELIDRNGAPSGQKIVAIYNPPVVNRQLGIRRSSAFAVRSIASELLRSGAQTIVFSPSRSSVEVLLTYLRGALKQLPGAPERVRGYRGGYLPLERRAIERGLRDGSVRGVVATNALELGIDIGGLEASVLHGYPGSLASTWQQFGRAGRRGTLSFAVLVATSSPLNQYIATHPEFVFEGVPEAGRINPDNLIILSSHLKCAAFELPFAADEQFGAQTAELLELLADEEVLYRSGDRYHWSAESFPAESISLRSAAIDNFVVIDTGQGPPGPDGGPKPRVIGEVDRPSAPTLIHDEAIYMHGGEQYHVDRLDWEEKKAYVHRVDVDYYTDANLAVDLKVLEAFESGEAGAATRYHGEVALSFVATVFKKIKLDTHENVGWGKIHLPQEDLHTAAYWFALGPEATGELRGDELQGGLWAVGNLLVNVAPLFLLCDPRDVRAVAQVKSPFSGAPTVFLYENHPGGVGFSDRLYTEHERLLTAARALARACPCQSGCPSCVGPANELSGDPKAAALALLARASEERGKRMKEIENRSG
ncbi:MAG TPA: DEAD/DEAH box helicase [Dehalococcoidia bacterium]|nr:DEAD/DEAH box helicase [Dehalococcoidia bacterium]